MKCLCNFANVYIICAVKCLLPCDYIMISLEVLKCPLVYAKFVKKNIN